MDNQELVPIQPANQLMVAPAVSAEEGIKIWKQYQDLKEKIKMPEDVQRIQGRDFLKKSYWRKIARFFNLSVEITEEKKEELGERWFAYHFKARATAPNGAFAEGVGSCDNKEKQEDNSIHNTRSTAETRAWNRAVSNLVGGGEVSAEEMQTSRPQKPPIEMPKPLEATGEVKPLIYQTEDGKIEAEGTLVKFYVNETKKKDKNGDIIFVTKLILTNGKEEVEISKFGKPKESLKEGKRLHCLDIRTSEYNGVPQYLVDKIEIR